MLYIFVWIMTYYFCQVSGGNTRSYATENCGHVIGPDYGAFIEFDRDAREKKGTISVPDHLKGSVMECLIVIRGMPARSTRKRWMAMHWKEFYIRDQSVSTIKNSPEDCKKAYVIMYAGMDRTAPNLGTYCGKDILVRNFEFEGEYITLFFYIDYRNPNLPTTTTSANTDDKVTTRKPPTTTEDTFPYPLAFFKLDVTSFDYDCDDTVPGVTMKCNDSHRCIDDSLRCDYWYSRNCVSPKYPKDKSDSGRFSPALCWVKSTTTIEPTTTLPPVPEPFDYTPVGAGVGGLVGFVLLVWCCCRPGYLPWRCTRLRNLKCVSSCRSNIPCCMRCGSRCTCRNRTCVDGEYDPSPTGSAAAMKMRQQRLLDSSSQGSGNTSVHYHGKSLKSKIFPCFPDSVIGRRIGAVAPMDRLGILNDDDFTPFPYDRIPQYGNFPNGPTNNDIAMFDMREDPEGLSSGWIKLIFNDGSHLREQR